MNDHAAQPDAALADVGLIGLAVMGQNLVLNMAENGHSVKVYNRTIATAEQFVAEAPDNFDITMGASLREFVVGIRRPRRVLLLVRAGAAVDSLIESLGELLEPGDLVVDTGNSDYRDYGRRAGNLEAHGVRYVGAGVSGGEEGARFGPAIMPGGASDAWPMIEPLFSSIAATAPDGAPCTAWMGPGGSGHFVKMVHNGIEYGDMQVLAEVVALLGAMGVDAEASSKVLQRWNQGRLASFLVEITSKILTHRNDSGERVLPLILDTAGQKGTGRWTAMDALDRGVPLTLISEAVAARSLSADRDLRLRASLRLAGPGPEPSPRPERTEIDHLEAAAWTAKLVSYAQGFEHLRTASMQHDWSLDLGSIARIWRAGCIIRADALDEFATCFEVDPDEHLLLMPSIAESVSKSQASLRRAVVYAARHGLATPALSAALAYYDGLRQSRGTAALIQAQRDWFGAHTYERVDRPRGEFFHTDWVGSGAAAISGSYSA